MSYYLDVIKDSPIGLWKLDESSGSVAYDISGCDNHASYVGQIVKFGMPIVSGGNHSNKIDSSNYIQFTISKDFSSKGKSSLTIKKSISFEPKIKT
mgnify:CR=1 FL=1